MATKSTAVWCSLKSDRRVGIEAHFNYWRMSHAKSSAQDFLDVGIMALDPAELDQISIFVPFEVEDAEDLGGRFVPVVAQGIFNKPLDCKNGANGKWIDLLEDDNLHCRVCVLVDEDITIEAINGGSVITVVPRAITDRVVGLKDGGKLYFRLRVLIPGGDNPFITVIKPSDRFLLSGYDEVEYVAFGLNEARTLPRPVEQKMQDAQGQAEVLTVAFLTAVPVAMDLSASSAQFHKTRLLERSIWDSYVEGGIPDGMMVYHWRKDDPTGVGDFAAFVKLRNRRTGKATLLTYLVAFFVLSIIANLASSRIDSWLGKRWSAASSEGSAISPPDPATLPTNATDKRPR